VFYAWDITITAGTLETAPKTQTLKLTAGVIINIDAKFPRGCHGLVKIRLFHHGFQLVPLSRGQWVTGDDEPVKMPHYFELTSAPYALKFQGVSPGTTFNHTVTVRVTVLPKSVASMIPVIELLTRLLQRMGVLG